MEMQVVTIKTLKVNLKIRPKVIWTTCLSRKTKDSILTNFAGITRSLEKGTISLKLSCMHLV